VIVGVVVIVASISERREWAKAKAGHKGKQEGSMMSAHDGGRRLNRRVRRVLLQQPWEISR
jgi:hypothetical protein